MDDIHYNLRLLIVIKVITLSSRPFLRTAANTTDSFDLLILVIVVSKEKGEWIRSISVAINVTHYLS